MTALCARHLRLGVEPAPGVQAEVINRYPKDADGRAMLPDLAHGAEAWALLRLDVTRCVSAARLADTVHLLSVKLEYRDLEDRIEFAGPIHLGLPCLPAEAFASHKKNLDLRVEFVILYRDRGVLSATKK